MLWSNAVAKVGRTGMRDWRDEPPARGKNPAVIADVLDQVDAPAVTFFSGSSLEDAVGVLKSAHIDHVILGGGLALGPESYLPFVRAVLRGFDLGR